MTASTVNHRKHTKQKQHTEVQRGSDWTPKVGFYSSLASTVGGIVYFLVLVAAGLTGRLTFPPSEEIQIFGGVASLLFCPVIVVMVAALHAGVPTEKKIFSQISLGFSLLFAMAVSINRFSQLGVIRQSMLAGNTDGIGWFLAYGDHSVMLGLEYLGWSWFLGLALLFAAPIFGSDKLQRWLRWLLVVYGVLGMVSAVGFLLANPLSMIGFFNWGVLLVVITGLLSVYFRRGYSR